jgi:hypothetical protein
MRRIVVLLTVVAMMVGMLAVSVAPAFAAKDSFNCRLSDRFVTTTGFTTAGIPPDRNGDGIFCIYGNTVTGKTTFTDNHPVVVE